MSKLFDKNMMEYRPEIVDWKTAVTEGVKILEKNGYATNALADAIIDSTAQYGAYYVLEKGIALLHAKPDNYAKKMGVSFILLENDVQFNDEDKYARLIFTLSAPNSTDHIGVIEEFGKLFTDEKIKKEIFAAKTIEGINNIIDKIDL